MKRFIFVKLSAVVFFLGLLSIAGFSQGDIPSDSLINQPKPVFSVQYQFESLIDRVGATVPFDELILEINSSNFYSETAIVGDFKLFFMQGSGLLSADEQGILRRAVVIEFFENMSDIIDYDASTKGYINVRFNDFSQSPLNNYGVDIFCSSYYLCQRVDSHQSFIIDCVASQKINTSVDPFYSLGGSTYRSLYNSDLISVSHLDFYIDFTELWNLDLSRISILSTEKDLYTGLLREFVVGLGANSFIGEDGTSILGGSRVYSRFDQCLENMDNLPLLVELSDLSLQWNSDINVEELFQYSSGCEGAENCNNGIQIKDSGIRLYNSDCFIPGISMNYISSYCSTNYSAPTGFTNIDGNVLRRMTDAEFDILGSLGYSLSGCVGEEEKENNMCANVVANFQLEERCIYGISENLNFEYIFTSGDNVLNISEIFNDLQIDCIHAASDKYYLDFGVIVNCAAQSISCSSSDQSKVLLIPFNYKKGDNSFLKYLLVKMGGSSCISPCNFLENGSFESVSSPWCGAIDNPDELPDLVPVNVQCWSGFTYSPDIMSNSSNCLNTDFQVSSSANVLGGIINPPPTAASEWSCVRLGAVQNTTTSLIYEEGIQGFLGGSLLPGVEYIVSLYARKKSPMNPDMAIYFRSGEYVGDGINTAAPGLNLITVPFTPVDISNTNWELYEFSFVCPMNQMSLDHIVIVDRLFGTHHMRNLLIDDVKVRPFDSFNLPETICLGGSITNLNELVFPTGGSFSGPGVLDNNFNSQNAGIGEHTIIYSYSDPNTGCLRTIEQSITVMGPANFGTASITNACPGTPTGNVSVLVTFSSTPINDPIYTWSSFTTGQVITSSTGSVLNNVFPGEYELTVNVDGCESSETYLVGIQNLVPITSTVSNDICISGSCNAEIVLSGPSEFDVVWSGGSLSGTTNAAPTGVCPGTYSASVTDLGGCTQIINVVVPASVLSNLLVTSNQTFTNLGTLGNVILGDPSTATTGISVSFVNVNAEVTGEIIVNAGSRLVLDVCNLNFGPNGRIVVKKGGRLIVQTSHLTSACPNTFWKGIFVEGNPNSNQTDAQSSESSLTLVDGDGLINSGSCFVTKSSVIEFASIGIRNYLYPGSPSGGYVHVNGSTLRNNALDIDFRAYGNQSTNVHVNLSKFTGATFELNSNRIPGSVSVYKNRVELNSTFGVSFKGCIFKNTDNTLIANYSVNDVSNGHFSAIQASQAPFTITNASGSPSRIEGFCYGIKISSGLNSAIYSIKNTTFSCYRGVRSLTAPFGTVFQNNVFRNLNSAPNITTAIPAGFTANFSPGSGPNFLNSGLPSSSNVMGNASYGIYLLGGGATTIKNNNFEILGNTNNLRIGVIVNNCGSSSIQILNNEFIGNIAGIRSYNVNRNSGTPSLSGTVYKCNVFSGNHRDVEINAFDLSNSANGMNSNIFETSPSGGFYSLGNDHDNIPSSVFLNWDDVANFTHSLHTIRAVNYEITESECNEGPYLNVVNSQVEPAHCLSIGSTLAGASLSTQVQLAVAMKQNYDAFIDNGNPAYLKSIVAQLNYANLLFTYQELMESSPTLSEERILEIIEKETTIPRSMLVEILSNNKGSLKGGYVMAKLDSLIEPLTAWEKELLFQSDEISTKEVLDLVVDNQYRIAFEMLGDSLERIFSDTLVIDKMAYADPLMGYFDLLTGNYSKLYRHLSMNQWNEASEVATEISLTLSPKFSEYKDLIVLLDLIEVLSNAIVDSTVSVPAEDLLGYYNSGLPVTSGLSASLLSLYYPKELLLPTDYPELVGSERSLTSTRVLESATELRISPNPASEFVILKSNKSMINSDITIENEIGQEVELKLLSSNIHEIVIDVSFLQPGMYYIYLGQGDNRSVGKLVIQ